MERQRNSVGGRLMGGRAGQRDVTTTLWRRVAEEKCAWLPMGIVSGRVVLRCFLPKLPALEAAVGASRATRSAATAPR